MATINPYERRQEIYNCILGKDASETVNADNNISIKNKLITKINNDFGVSRPLSNSSNLSFEMLDSDGEPLTKQTVSAPPAPPAPPKLPATASATNPPAKQTALLGALKGFNPDALKKVKLPETLITDLQAKTTEVETSTAKRNEVVSNLKNPDATSLAQQAMAVKLKPREQTLKPVSDPKQTELERVLAKLRDKESRA